MATTYMEGVYVVYHGLRIPAHDIFEKCRVNSDGSDAILMILGADDDACEVCGNVQVPSLRTNVLITYFPYIDGDLADQIAPNYPREAEGWPRIGIIELSTLCDNHRGEYFSSDLDEPDFNLAECDSYPANLIALRTELDGQNCIVVSGDIAAKIRELT